MDSQRDEMMKKVQMLSFVMVDVNLYLDTHPMDDAALKFYDKYGALLAQAQQEYNTAYGPLTPSAVNTADGWTWAMKPWPWEMEA